MPRKTDRTQESLSDLFVRRKFGIFIHWGLYSLPAGRWKGRKSPYIAEWIMKRERIPVREYEGLAAEFDPLHFDADQWLRRIADSGAKYLVVTAKHHDGFAMYRSRVSDYNVVDATPFGRDVIGELAEAARNHDIKFCIYYSHDQDWHHPHGFGNDWDYNESEKNFDLYFEEKVVPQVTELLTNYGPVGMVWFDTPVSISEEKSRRLYDLVHDLQPACLVSGRIGHGLGDFAELCDNGVPATVVDNEWETPLTMSNSWGYKVDDNNWKTPQTLIRQLSGIVGKGGNCLLNIGPDGNGRIPEPSTKILDKIGAWLRTNGEAIYCTRHNPFPSDCRWGTMTWRDKTLYLHVHQTHDNVIQLNGLATDAESVTWRQQKLRFTQARSHGGAHTLRVQLPERVDLDCPEILKVELQTPIEIDDTTTQQHDNSVVLEAGLADNLSAASAISINHHGAVSGWLDNSEHLAWKFRVETPGAFDVRIVTMGTRADGDPATPLTWEGGHEVSVKLDGQCLTGTIEKHEEEANPANPHFPLYITRIGKLALDRPGEYRLTLQATRIAAKQNTGFTFRAIMLV